MILGAEIAFVFAGLFALITGTFPISQGRVVRGAPARYLGLIALLPLPVSFTVGYALGFVVAATGVVLPPETWQLIAIPLEIGVLVIFFGLIMTLGKKLSEPAVPPSLEGDDRTADPAPGKPPLAASESDVWLPFDEVIVPRRWTRLLVLVSILASILLGIAVFLTFAPQPNPANNGGMLAAPPIALAPPPARAIEAIRPPAAVAPVPPAVDVAPAQPRQPFEGPIVGRAVRRPEASAAEAVPPVAITTEPVASGAVIGVQGRAVAGLRVTDLKVRAKQVPSTLIWGDGGQTCFVLERSGLLRRIALDGFREELRWEIGRTCSWLARSSEGLVVTVDGLGEVWTLDPATFAIRVRVAVPAAVRVESSPALAVGFATDRPGNAVTIVDLKAGQILAKYDARSFPGANVGFEHLAVTPDGRAIFAEGSERLLRFHRDGADFIFDQASPRIAQNGRRIDISPDGAHVALPSGGGNYDEDPYTTNVYRVDNLDAPEYRIHAGAYPQAIGFDPPRQLVYAQNNADSLIVFGAGGPEQRSYRLGTRGDSPRYFAVHPAGGKLFVLSNSALQFVEFVPPAAEQPATTDQPADDEPAAAKPKPKPIPRPKTGRPTRPTRPSRP